MVAVKYEFIGLKTIKIKLAKFRRGITNLMPVWPAIRDEFYKIEKKRFNTSNKGRWKPLSPKYAAWKDKNYPGKPIMVRTGDLMRSLSSMTADTIYNPSKREVDLGTSKKYAIWNHFGVKGKLPKRSLIALLRSEINRMKKIMDGYLDIIVGKF